MRKFTWLIAAGLVAGTTGCMETLDSGYPSAGYAPSSGYYSQPAYYQPVPANNYYYSPQPQVVTQTRYVPVAVPPERRDDRRWDGNRDGSVQHRDDRPQAVHQTNNAQPVHQTTNTQPVVNHATPNQPPASNGQQTNHRGSGSPNRNNDGTPDTSHADKRS